MAQNQFETFFLLSILTVGYVSMLQILPSYEFGGEKGTGSTHHSLCEMKKYPKIVPFS